MRFWKTMNLATKLTMIRIGIVPVFMIFTCSDNFYARVAALFIFIGAGITDLYDGAIARRTNTITPIGTFLDPLADKLIIAAALISFVELSEIHIPAWMVVCIISREFIITGLRTVAASKGKSIPADTQGKVKASTQVSLIILVLIILTVNSMLEHFWGIRVDLWKYSLDWKRVLGLFLTDIPYWMAFVVTAFTLYSGFSYIRKNWHLIDDRRSQRR